MTFIPSAGVPPETIGRYQVIDRLGSGAFATVYLAEDPALDTRVAIKVLASNLAVDPSIRGRFIDEARMVRRLAAPGLVTIYDIGEHDAMPYLVMELCENGTLHERLHQVGRPLTVGEALTLARAIASCLETVHAAGVVHRDLKPSNFLIRRRNVVGTKLAGHILSGDEELVVADFGLAKVVDLAASRLSLAGGTPGFSAPEQFRGSASVDATADVYAVSAIVASSILGVAPDPVLAPADSAFDPARLRHASPIDGELTRGLSTRPADRHQDVASWLDALERAARHGAAPGTARPPQQPAPAPSTRRTPPPPGPTYPDSFHPAVAGQPPGRTEATGWHPPSPPADQPPAAAHPQAAYAPPAQPSATPERQRPRRRRRRLLRLGVALLAVAALATGAVSRGGELLELAGLGGDSLVVLGPTEGFVNQEAAFVVERSDGQAVAGATWRINSEPPTTARVLSLTPSSAGPITIDVSTADGAEASLSYLVTVPESRLRIDGPGHVTVGQSAMFSASGGQDGELRWTIGGNPEANPGPSLDLRAQGPGTVTIELSSGDQTISRTILAVASDPG